MPGLKTVTNAKNINNKKEKERVMKKIKKMIALLLAFTMIFGIGLTTMAATPGDDETYGTEDDRGTITVNGIDAESNLVVTAYQIVKADYDETSGRFTGYSALYPDVDPAIDLTPDQNGKIEITLEQLNAIIAAQKVADTTYPMTKTNESYTATVPVGSYLVVVAGAETKIYSPMVVSVSYKNEEGSNAIEEGTVVTIEDGNAWVKESSVPTVSKVEEDALGNTNHDFDYGNSVDAGNNVAYTVTIDPIPYYGGDYPVLNVVDTLDPGLTPVADRLSGNIVTVKVGGTTLIRDEDYTEAYDAANHQITIDFVVDGEYTLNDYQGQAVEITYQAVLNTDAAFNDTPNVNTVVLNYTYDSKVNGRNGSEEESTYTYTFDLTDKLIKTDETDHPLSGATFELYTDEDCEEKYTNAFSNADGNYVSRSDGKISIKGLEAGTYYLKETEAPDGYSVNTTIYKIEVVATYQDTDPTAEDYGMLTEWAINVDGKEVGSFRIPNTKLVNLPSTGGIGTTIFTIVGCAGMVVAGSFLFVSRRKQGRS